KLNNLAAKNNDLQTLYLHLGLQKEQLQNSNQNLTVERNQLQMMNTDLNRDREKLQSSYKILTAENEQLQSSYKQLTVEKEQLQSSYKILTAENEQSQSSYKQLTVEKEQLQSSFKNLTVENEQLQSSYKNLTVENEQLQSSYKNLTAEKEELQNSYKNVTVEKDWLLTSYNNVTVERDWLQISLNNLTVVRDQDEKKCQKLADDMEKLQTNYSTVETQKNQLQKERDDMRNTFEELAKQARLGWVYFNSKMYFTSTEKKSWNEARQECKKNGADLVIIKTKEKQDFLLKQVGNDKAWIGLNDRNTEGTWKWVDDTLVNTGFWSPGEPNDSGNEDCAEIWGFAGKQGWNDGKCTSKSKWICEK
ncbi:C-type lectin domain family 4 member M, partial [Silurus meridionalis]